jgi:hypothetical protein
MPELPDAAVGVVDFDSLSAGIADDLREGGPRPAFSDVSELFAALRVAADPAEIMLGAGLLDCDQHLVPHRPARARHRGHHGSGRGRGAPARRRGDLRGSGARPLPRPAAHAHRRCRRGGEPALGARFAVRVSVAYKGNWVRRVVTIDRDLTAARNEEAAAAFAEAVARLPGDRSLSQFASFVVEGCRLAQPLEALMGSRVATPRSAVRRRHRFGPSLHRNRRWGDPARRPGSAGRLWRVGERFHLARLRLRPTSGIEYLAHSKWHGSAYRRIPTTVKSPLGSQVGSRLPSGTSPLQGTHRLVQCPQPSGNVA